MAGYTTKLGRYTCESSLDGLNSLDDNSIKLDCYFSPFQQSTKKEIYQL